MLWYVWLILRRPSCTSHRNASPSRYAHGTGAQLLGSRFQVNRIWSINKYAAPLWIAAFNKRPSGCWYVYDQHHSQAYETWIAKVSSLPRIYIYIYLYFWKKVAIMLIVEACAGFWLNISFSAAEFLPTQYMVSNRNFVIHTFNWTW